MRRSTFSDRDKSQRRQGREYRKEVAQDPEMSFPPDLWVLILGGRVPRAFVEFVSLVPDFVQLTADLCSNLFELRVVLQFGKHFFLQGFDQLVSRVALLVSEEIDPGFGTAAKSKNVFKQAICVRTATNNTDDSGDQ